MIIDEIFTDNNDSKILVWRAFHLASGYDCMACQFKCCYGPYNLPLVDKKRCQELISTFPLFKISLLLNSKNEKSKPQAFYHREVGCFFLNSNGNCIIHQKKMASDPQEPPLKPLVCQVFPLILRKARIDESEIRFIYVYPCGASTGFQWLSKNPISNGTIRKISKIAETHYQKYFADQIDSEDPYNDIKFNILEQYQWLSPYLTTLKKPIFDALQERGSLSNGELNALSSEIIDFLFKWNRYSQTTNNNDTKSLLSILNEKDIAKFNAFAAWLSYNARMMEIKSPTLRWKLVHASLTLTIYHLILSNSIDLPTINMTTNRMINEACWDTVHLIVTTLPSLAREGKITRWNNLNKLFRQVSP